MSDTVLRYLIAIAIGAGVWLAGWFVGRFLLGGLMRIIHRTPTDLDDIVFGAIRPQIHWWAALLGVVVGARYGGLAPPTQAIVDRAAGALFLLSLTLAASRFLTDLVARRSAQFSGVLPATTLTQNVVRIGVIGMGLLVIAGNLGIAITPILTALGVGSLAVALALQPTLSNLFAGFHITLARQLHVGDFVELETGAKGFVTDIGWRSTQIRELPDNIIIVPNARLTEMVVKNYAAPGPQQAALVQVGVSYGSDLKRVEEVTLDVARGALREVTGGVPEFEPLVRYHTFGDSSIDFTVVLRVQTFPDRYLVTHEFLKRLHRRYAEEGIEIPFPQRVLHLAEGPVVREALQGPGLRR